MWFRPAEGNCFTNTHKPIKANHVWFDPGSDDELPPSYRVYISESRDDPSFCFASVVAMNTDTPTAPGWSGQSYWHLSGRTDVDGLFPTVISSLSSLNPGREIHLSDERWIEPR